MANVYEDGFLTAAANAIAGLGNRIGLYTSTGARVGTVYTDTTWGTTTLSGSGAARKAEKPGSEVEITVPGGTVPNGTQITQYGVLNGTTLQRRVDLEPLTLTVNDGSKEFKVKVTPKIEFNPVE